MDRAITHRKHSERVLVLYTNVEPGSARMTARRRLSSFTHLSDEKVCERTDARQQFAGNR
jgi:hypothetical protein